MTTDPTLNDLLKQGLISDADADAAVDTFMADPALRAFIFGDVCRLNLGAAVKARRHALDTLRDPEASPDLRRAAVREAILLARPQKI
jgi:hypothetical protein